MSFSLKKFDGKTFLLCFFGLNLFQFIYFYYEKGHFFVDWVVALAVLVMSLRIAYQDKK